MPNARCWRRNRTLIFGRPLSSWAAGKSLVQKEDNMNRLLLRLVIILTLITMLLSLVAPVTLAGAQAPNGFLPDEVLVKLHRASDVAGLAAEIGRASWRGRV